MGLRDQRRDSKVAIALRVFFFLLTSFFAFVFLKNAGDMVGDPQSAISRYRQPATMPHVLVKGTLHRTKPANESLPPLCHVDHERYGRCGKSNCWQPTQWFQYANARVDITWASAPLPSSMDLGASFAFEPWMPTHEVISDDDRATVRTWKELGKASGLGFEDEGFIPAYENRIATTCAQEGDQVFLEACVSPKRPAFLDKCPGTESFAVIVNGEAQAAVDAAADNVARYVGCAALALLLAVLCWLRSLTPVAAGLEDRAPSHRRSLGYLWSLLAVPPVLALSVVFMHALHPPNSFSSGRGGFVFAISMLIVWFLFAAQRWLHRRRTLFALAPVLATPRSLLAEASGTVELAVKAKGDELRSFLDGRPVAFSQVVVRESYRDGKNIHVRELHKQRQRDALKVVDESGDGMLDLTNAVLDVEEQTRKMADLEPLDAALVDRHDKHVQYIVTEWTIRDGESLYVLGEVSGIALQASESGYRTVRGSPTLGGKDAAPILVYSGDERGLIASLSREARAANSYAVVAACMCTGIAAALIALARL